MAIRIFTTPTCPWCVKAKDLLKSQKIDFEEIDVAENEKGRDEMLKKTGQMGVPVLDINGTMIVGFDKEAFTNAIKLS